MHNFDATDVQLTEHLVLERDRTAHLVKRNPLTKTTTPTSIAGMTSFGSDIEAYRFVSRHRKIAYQRMWGKQIVYTLSPLDPIEDDSAEEDFDSTTRD